MTTPAARAGEARKGSRSFASLLWALALALVPAIAAAQGQVQDGTGAGGALPWVFVAFAVAALVVVFLVFRWLRRPPERPPFNRPRS
jgi:sterol desaturase/sphingolipid hydroxylase (fatty acid hydroxylase superfamily)